MGSTVGPAGCLTIWLIVIYWQTLVISDINSLDFVRSIFMGEMEEVGRGRGGGGEGGGGVGLRGAR